MIYNDNCINGTKKLETDSIDLIVTDPPYGMSFMGKNWDKALPPLEAFEEMYRVLKPGAFAFVMCAPRSDLQARMSILLEDAGFNIAFTPYRDWETDRKSTRLNSSHSAKSRMPSSA